MRFRKIGGTDIEVSVIAMGCWAIVGGDTWGPQEEADSVAAINAALDSGITTFDTAEGYGSGYSEEVLGRTLEGRREEAVIATKVSRRNLSPDSVIEACEASLRRLRTDYIDIYQIHWPSREIPLSDTIPVFQKLVEAGKIRAFGVSNFGKGDLSDLLEIRRPEVNQLPYSLLFRAVEYEIQPVCAENNVSILCYSPLMQGLLTGKFRTPADVPEGRARTRLFSSDRPNARHSEPGCETEAFEAIRKMVEIAGGLGEKPEAVALAWLLAQPAVGSVLVGVRNPEQARANAAAGGLELPQEALDALSEATQDVKDALGPNPDLWQSESRYR